MPTGKRVLFLDFDGVVNSIRSAHAFGGYPWNVNSESLKMFDVVALGLIRRLCKENDIDIILSSTWRRAFTPAILADALDLPIKDKTPILNENCRGQEIQEWLNSHPEITEYVILDDDSDMLPDQRSRFVQTCPYEGFRWKDFEEVKKIFKITKGA